MDLNKKIENAIAGPLDHRGYGVVLVRTVGGRKPMVEVDIERLDDGPVGIDDCVAASRIISAILDVEDFINGSYNLNVSSPGDIRPIKKLCDFERFCGKNINVEFINPIDGKRKISGKLMRVEQNSSDAVVYLKEECNTGFVELRISYENIKKAYMKRAF